MWLTRHSQCLFTRKAKTTKIVLSKAVCNPFILQFLGIFLLFVPSAYLLLLLCPHCSCVLSRVFISSSYLIIYIFVTNGWHLCFWCTIQVYYLEWLHFLVKEWFSCSLLYQELVDLFPTIAFLLCIFAPMGLLVRLCVYPLLFSQSVIWEQTICCKPASKQHVFGRMRSCSIPGLSCLSYTSISGCLLSSGLRFLSVLSMLHCYLCCLSVALVHREQSFWRLSFSFFILFFAN